MNNINSDYTPVKAKRELKNRERRANEELLMLKNHNIKLLALALEWFETIGWKAYDDEELWGKGRRSTNYLLMAKAMFEWIDSPESGVANGGPIPK